MGRAYRYQRRLSHIIISVAERSNGGAPSTKAEPEEKPVAKKAPAKKASAKKTAAKKATASKKAAK
jgi:large subunit ribosomal protein L22